MVVPACTTLLALARRCLLPSLFDAGPPLAKAFYKAEVMIEQGQGLNSASAEVPRGGSPEYSCFVGI